MRRFAWVIGAALPLVWTAPVLAEDVVIRIEAKRGAEAAAQTAAAWGAQFPDVVTFPAGSDWVAIALGPMPREAAAVRLEQLKAENKVPGDSFLSPAEGRELTRIGAADSPAAPADAAPAAGSASTFPQDAETAAPEPAVGDLAGEDAPAPEPAAAPAVEPAAEPAPEPVAEPAPAQFFLRLDSSPDRAKAEELLETWRQTLPEAGLWTLPNGRSAVAFGPMDEVTGKAWLRALRNAGAVPKDAFLSPGEDMGEIAIIGAKPDLGAPPAEDAAPVPMPPLEQIQRALRWAGHYQGAIDGKDGPMTQKAIAEEIVRLRASPDTATAMAELIRRREAWRAEMGLTPLQDAHTGLMLPAPMDRLQFDRAERALSIYGPKDGSGAALILFSQPGGQQEMLDIAGLVTALGWVPAPERKVERGSVMLDGRNQTHIGHAEGRVVDGRVQGFVLIWPISDPEDQVRLAAEISDNLSRFAPGAGEAQPEVPAIAPAAAAQN
ncbi:peptidoglycan-binding domain-containing protein [Paracoccus aminovorans]|uniref:peptidoglycan-binding domain-containing protein n=1 Tax=Paracoccus aminovorans TaxID=34004 RepID=UPI0007851779|nr:peptidoglycan-binding domain-containing protein [Paracoccus aminovorans]MDQ7776489.1 peptidoglycan-binding domain-containing protein [Paracoccus aminovorans]